MLLLFVIPVPFILFACVSRSILVLLTTDQVQSVPVSAFNSDINKCVVNKNYQKHV